MYITFNTYLILFNLNMLFFRKVKQVLINLSVKWFYLKIVKKNICNLLKIILILHPQKNTHLFKEQLCQKY